MRREARTVLRASTTSGSGPLLGVPWKATVPDDNGNFNRGTLFDAQAYFRKWLGLMPQDELRVLHRTSKRWAKPGVPTDINPMKAKIGIYGRAFYTATQPEKDYGPVQFRLSLPMRAFAGKKVLEVRRFYETGSAELPPGVDVLVNHFRRLSGEQVWVIFKPGSEKWVNQVSTESYFDGE